MDENNPNLVTIYSDGACSGNPGPGGWGTVLRFGGHEKCLSGAEALTTNNRMELMAAIMGLEALSRPCPVVLFTDSIYVKDGITKWIYAWKNKGWKKADGKPVINADLWQRLDLAKARHDVEFRWIKGHAGHEGNEAADLLARNAITQLRAAK